MNALTRAILPTRSHGEAGRVATRPQRRAAARCHAKGAMPTLRARRHARAMTDLDIADDLGAGAEHHAAPDLGMAVAVVLAGAAERHAVQDRYVVLDHRGLAHYQAGGMVEEDAPPDRRRRMDVG